MFSATTAAGIGYPRGGHLPRYPPVCSYVYQSREGAIEKVFFFEQASGACGSLRVGTSLLCAYLARKRLKVRLEGS